RPQPGMTEVPASHLDRETKLSAVIACYRDAPAVPVMHERLTAVFGELGCDYEIIFVNDGSPDDAREVLGELARRDPKVTVINHSRAFGSQSAFTSGMQIATGDAVVLMDGDLQDPPELIPEFVEHWLNGSDVVFGQRTDREASRVMRVAYKGFYRLFRRLSYLQIPLDAGDFSLIDRRAVDALNSLPEKHRFIRGLRSWVGFKQTGVPYKRPERMFGETTNSLVKNLGWARRAILSFSYTPLDLMMWLGLITVGISFLAITGTITLRIVDPGSAPRGITTVLVVVLFVGGIQLLCLSIIGSYLAHMYEEVKGRPSFVVDEVINPPTERLRAPKARLTQGAGEESGSSERGRPPGDPNPPRGQPQRELLE
ncbi:MAG: glycosyltransferase family 2 protein, partial [Solirubrobacterales bacterium]